MSVTIVILLLVAAIALILIEIFLIPGVGIPGIIGLALMAVALFLGYSIDTTTGHFTLVGSLVASGGLMALALRSKTWTKMSVQNEISSRVDQHADRLAVGDEGVAITRLNPIGNARFGEDLYEVRSRGEYLAEHSRLKIINIERDKITVESFK
jgi:membrane-bound ClpP family serine protease